MIEKIYFLIFIMTLFAKIYKNNKSHAWKDILSLYKQQGYVVVNYLYFANLVANGILWKGTLNKEYLKALDEGDFLLPDGVALQMYYKKLFWFSLDNLNGTDFSEYILQNIIPENTNVILYGAKSDVISQASTYLLEKYNISVFYFQDGYSEFDVSVLETLPKKKVNILMVGLGTPKQEIWMKKHLAMIQEYKFIVFAQGGTFDFWAGNEKRAPRIFLWLKWEWVRRFIWNPKKNFKKVWYSLYLFYYLKSKGK